MDCANIDEVRQTETRKIKIEKNLAKFMHTMLNKLKLK
jgi:hypothetical protein